MARGRALVIAAGATGALLAAAAPAAADSKITIAGDVLYLRNDDAGISNQLTVDLDSRGRTHFVDDADPYGMTYPATQCSPGRLNSAGNPVEVTCERRGYSSMTFEIGPGEDRVSYRIDDLPLTADGREGADTLVSAAADDALHGGQGNDTLDTGAGNDTATGGEGSDTLRTGDGNDRLDGGTGQDSLDAGPGDDAIVAADGVADTIDCGPGADQVNADTGDRLVNCETESRQQVAAPAGAAAAGAGPSGGGAAAEDTDRPVVQVGGSTRQRVGTRRRRMVIAVSASERALVNVSGFLDVGGTYSPVKPSTARVTVPGGGVLVTLTLSRSQARRVLADLRRRRRPMLRLTVSAVDAAGNTSPPRRLVIALRR